MKTKTCILLIQFALCHFATAGAAQTNLLVNGGFETPTVSRFTTFIAPSSFLGWTVASGGVDIVADSFYATASGIQSLDLNSVVSGSIVQNVTTTPRQVYRVSFAFAANPLPDSPSFPSPVIKQMEVRWDGIVLGALAHNSTGHTATDVGWHDYTLSVVGTGANTLSFASLTPGSAGPALDNVRIVAVPEPSACLWLTAALCAVAALARTRFTTVFQHGLGAAETHLPARPNTRPPHCAYYCTEETTLCGDRFVKGWLRTSAKIALILWYASCSINPRAISDL